MKNVEDNSCSGTSSFVLRIFSFGLVLVEHWIGTHCLPSLDFDDLEEVCNFPTITNFFGTHSCSSLTMVTCVKEVLCVFFGIHLGVGG